MKTGVCHHFKILYNTLLFSINIPVIYFGGNVISDIRNNDLDGREVCSLVKIDNKWFPMDVI